MLVLVAEGGGGSIKRVWVGGRGEGEEGRPKPLCDIKAMHTKKSLKIYKLLYLSVSAFSTAVLIGEIIKLKVTQNV